MNIITVDGNNYLKEKFLLEKGINLDLLNESHIREMPNIDKKILITGYTYVDADSIKTFDYYPASDAIIFLVPDRWLLKKGKQVFIPPKKANIITATVTAFSAKEPWPISRRPGAPTLPVSPVEYGGKL